MAINRTSPKTGKIIDIPDQTVTIGTATDGGTGSTASVPFTTGSVATGGPVYYFTATSTPGSFTANASASPITVSGLTSGTAYTFKVKAGNPSGYSSAGESAASNSLTILDPPTAYQHIATVTATGSETALTFSSILQTYDHLQIRGFAQRSGSGSVGIHGLNINGSSTAADYSMHITRTSEGGNYLLTTTDITSAYSQARSTFVPMSANIANNFGWMIADITGYSETTKTKAIRTVGGYTYNGTAYSGYYGHMGFASNYYNSTSAITSVSVTLCGDTFSAGSTYSLYGIKGSV